MPQCLKIISSSHSLQAMQNVSICLVPQPSDAGLTGLLIPVFFNSLLAMLNARRKLNSQGSGGSGGLSSNGASSYRLPQFTPGQSRRSAHIVSIDSRGHTELQSFTDLSDSKFGKAVSFWPSSL